VFLLLVFENNLECPQQVLGSIGFDKCLPLPDL
jgi:hypothetical protein